MSQSSTIYLGTTKSSYREVDNRSGTVAAGKAVYLHSPDTINTTASGGALLGVSLGKSQSDTARTAICRKGLDVPILLDTAFTPTIGTQVQISTTTGLAVASGTAVNAIYKSAALACIDEDGASVADGCALIDFQGGL
jgi:adhesin HecA-like repeat protein